MFIGLFYNWKPENCLQHGYVNIVSELSRAPWLHFFPLVPMSWPHYHSKKSVSRTNRVFFLALIQFLKIMLRFSLVPICTVFCIFLSFWLSFFLVGRRNRYLLYHIQPLLTHLFFFLGRKGGILSVLLENISLKSALILF